MTLKSESPSITSSFMTVIIALGYFTAPTVARPDSIDKYNDRYMHPRIHRISTRSVDNRIPHINEAEYDSYYWRTNAQETLSQKLLQKLNTNIAKNVIMFLGDGMSIPTLKASRLYLGQLHNESGEETVLSFERFPYVGLSKTYCVDKQVPDSACTATAYLGGVKNNEATIGVTAKVQLGDCKASLEEFNRVDSIANWSQIKNKKTGFVTTTRITHASPAGLYAHTADRDWESDADGVPAECEDIAHQLIYSPVGRNFHVILGGGRKKFIPSNRTDEEGDKGDRKDGEDLTDTWLRQKGGYNAKYVWNKSELLSVTNTTEYLLGLFESDHCKYHLDMNEDDPTLEEMTEKAIELLSTSDNGYFLFVEGGRIDHAHHDTKAKKSLDETIELHKAVKRAVEITDERETLIVVTSDHAHTMSISGYTERGNDIFGIAGMGDDNLPYTTISYANGPGYRETINGKRHDLLKDDRDDKNYKFPTTAPLDQETHGGDEVAIFAKGPWAHLFTGMIEQNAIPHFMAYASCVGEGLTICNQYINDRKKKEAFHQIAFEEFK